MDATESFGATLGGIELRQLRELAAVFEHGSISAAARQLHVRQPTLSRSMRAVERAVGVELFGRSARGVVPTAYGSALLQYHRALEANLRNAASELDAIRGTPAALIRIGVGPIEGSTVASAAISRFLGRFPDAQLAIREGLYANLEPALAKGELDLILGGEPRTADGLAHAGMKLELLGHLRPTIVVRASHPLAAQPRVTIEDLQRYPWIVPYGNAASQERFRETFLQAGLMPPAGNIFAPLSSWTAVGLVRENDLVALLPQQLIRHELATGALTALTVPGRVFEAPVYLITRAETVLSTTCRRLLRDIREVCASLSGEIV